LLGYKLRIKKEDKKTEKRVELCPKNLDYGILYLEKGSKFIKKGRTVPRMRAKKEKENLIRSDCQRRTPVQSKKQELLSTLFHRRDHRQPKKGQVSPP